MSTYTIPDETRDAALGALLKTMFPDAQVNPDAYRPRVWWGDKSIPHVEAKWVQGGTIWSRNRPPLALQLTFFTSYQHTQMRRVKVERGQDTHGAPVSRLDQAKVDAIAVEFNQLRQRYITNTAAAEQATRERNARLASEFAALKAQLGSVVFYASGDTGGTILLTSNADGPRIVVEGNTALLKLTTHTRDSMVVQSSLIPDFVELFGRNAAKP